ncbi:hypothetical protein D3C76_1340290 [compost metagenome]
MLRGNGEHVVSRLAVGVDLNGDHGLSITPRHLEKLIVTDREEGLDQHVDLCVAIVRRGGHEVTRVVVNLQDPGPPLTFVWHRLSPP